MIQGPVQCLGCKKYEEHSNAQMLLPCPTNKHAGEAQDRTFLQIWESNAPPPPRLLCKGISCTGGRRVALVDAQHSRNVTHPLHMQAMEAQSNG